MGPGKVTLDALISTIRARADMENSAFVTDAEITDFIRSSAGEFWDSLVTAYAGYAEASKTYTTDGTNALTIPDNMLKADGLDLEIGDATGGRISLQRIAWADRNKYRWPLNTPWPTHYCLRGNYVYLFPTPIAGKTITLWYVPRMTPLANSGTVQMLPEITSGHGMTINGVQFLCMPKTLGTTCTVTLGTSGPATIPAGTEITLSGKVLYLANDVVTAAAPAWQNGHTYSAESIVSSGGLLLFGGAAYGGGSGVSGATAPTFSFGQGGILDGTCYWSCWGAGSAYALGTLVTRENLVLQAGNTYPGDRPTLLQSAPTPMLSSITNGFVDSTYSAPTSVGVPFLPFAADIARVLTMRMGDATSTLYGLSARAVGDVVTITCARPSKVTISALSPTIYCPFEEWASYLEGFDGWEELLILDVVIKCKVKDEADISADLALKDRLQQRIRDAAANRDQGGPGLVSEIWDPYGIGVGLGPYYGRWGQ